MLELGNTTDVPSGAFQRCLCKGKTADWQRYSINTLPQWTGGGYTWFPGERLYWEEQMNYTSTYISLPNACTLNSQVIHYCNEHTF